MKIALTGANGFLGAYIVQEFLGRGYEVIALVREGANCSQLPSDPNLKIETVDYSQSITDQYNTLKSRHGELTYFIHNAGVTVSLDKREYYQINTELANQIVDAIKSTQWLSKAGKIVYVSSMAAQGPFGVGHPVSIYGDSKLKAEKYFKESGYDHLIIRPTGIYGAGDYAFLPLFKGAKSGLYPLTSNSQKMSMIHAKDLAFIIGEEAGKNVEILHVNDGQTYYHEDFISALTKATGKKIRKIPVPVFASKIYLTLSDLWHKLRNKRPGLTREKFQEISMDWHLHEDKELVFSKIPCQISLEEGFRDAFEFYKNKKLL